MPSTVVVKPTRTNIKSSGFESLNDDTLDWILLFVGKKSYLPFGCLNKQCRKVFLASKFPKETYLSGYAPLSMIKEKVTRGRSDNDNFYRGSFYYQIGDSFVSYNRHDILRWLVLEEYKLQVISAFNEAAEVSLDTLKRVKDSVGQKGFTSMEIHEYWSVCFISVCNGRLDVLKWLKNNGWFDLSNASLGTEIAARKGYLPIIKWLVENGCPLDEFIFAEAVVGGNLNVLEFLKQNCCPFYPDSCLYEAATKGNLQIIKWLLKNGCSLADVDKWTFETAARKGHLQIIKWFVENGCSIRIVNEVSFKEVAEGGHLHVMQWLHENGCPFDKLTFAYATRCGKVENLEWLLDSNFPWDKNCYLQATEYNKLDTLQWLLEQGCPQGDIAFLM